MTQALDRMPEMGCVDSIKYTVVHFLISMVSAVVGGIWIYLLVAYGIPLLITGHL